MDIKNLFSVKSVAAGFALGGVSLQTFAATVVDWSVLGTAATDEMKAAIAAGIVPFAVILGVTAGAAMIKRFVR